MWTDTHLADSAVDKWSSPPIEPRNIWIAVSEWKEVRKRKDIIGSKRIGERFSTPQVVACMPTMCSYQKVLPRNFKLIFEKNKDNCWVSCRFNQQKESLNWYLWWFKCAKICIRTLWVRIPMNTHTFICKWSNHLPWGSHTRSLSSPIKTKTSFVPSLLTVRESVQLLINSNTVSNALLTFIFVLVGILPRGCTNYLHLFGTTTFCTQNSFVSALSEVVVNWFCLFYLFASVNLKLLKCTQILLRTLLDLFS